MKTRNIFYLALAFMALSCAKEIAPETAAPEQDFNVIPMTFTAGMSEMKEADATKTGMENGYQIKWNKNDGVTIIDNVAKTAVQYVASEAGATTTLTPATEGTGVAAGATEIYGAYPWRSGNNALKLVNGDELDMCYMTPDQRPSRNGYYASVHYAMAKADEVGNLHFKNVNAFIKFTIAEELNNLVHAVYIFSNNDEEITGAFKMKWNNGEPQFVYKDDSSLRTHARIYNTSNGATVPLRNGAYFIGILPTTFQKGFTVVLQMVDGTQLYKRTEKTITVKEGQILPMKTLAKADYSTDDINYYVLYNEGFTEQMKISGISFDLFGRNKDGIPISNIVTSNSRFSSINGSNNLYFVTPSAKNAVISGSGKTNYAVIGMSKKHRSTVELNTHMGVAENTDRSSIFMLANLDVNVTADVSLWRGYPKEFGNIVINNCSFKGLRRHLLDIHNCTTYGVQAITQSVLYRTIIEDSEFCFKDCTNDYSILQRSQRALWTNTFKFVNNVVTATGCSGKNFRVLAGAGDGKMYKLDANGNKVLDSNGKEIVESTLKVGVTVDDLTVSRNTYHNTWTQSLVNVVGIDDVFMCEKNVYDIALTKNVEQFTVYQRYDVDAKINPASGYCRNNYYYSNGNAYKWTTPSSYTANLTVKDQPVVLSASPLSSIWDPANGKFGAYSFSVASGTAPAYNEAGAQRADMTPVTAALDSPAANYVNIDLGSY